jgi:hypothetical protein
MTKTSHYDGHYDRFIIDFDHFGQGTAGYTCENAGVNFLASLLILNCSTGQSGSGLNSAKNREVKTCNCAAT